MSRHGRLRHVLSALVLAQWLACLRAQVPTASYRTSVRVDVISVGQGDSILVSSPTGKHVLIDGGEAEAGPAVMAVLRLQNACPLDMILLTHRHADHLGGLKLVVQSCGAKLFVDSGYPHESAMYARLLEALHARGIPLHQAESGRQVELGGGALLTLLGPPRPAIDRASDSVNANSVVSRLEMGKTSMLFAADAEAQEEEWLLRSGLPLRSTVLKVGHHGSRTSTTAEFVAAVAPWLAVISSAAGDAKHPHPETLDRLKNVRVLKTAREGTIHLELDGQTVTFYTEKHSEEGRSP
jgi:competence protein ComEC